VTTLYTTARANFESWAALDAPHLPADPVDAMQVQLARWQAANFGPQSDERFALGVLEECGELDAAIEAADAIDALGDVLVYAGQLATSNRLALGPLLVPVGKAGRLLATAGNLSHVVLKRAQRIRGGAGSIDQYRADLASAIARVADAALEVADRICADGFLSPAEVYLQVGEQVLARDWTVNPTTGVAAPEDAR
jgi:hypothetical protein